MVASRALVIPKWTCASSGGCGRREWASWGVWVRKGGVKVGTVRRGRGGRGVAGTPAQLWAPHPLLFSARSSVKPISCFYPSFKECA